MNKADVTFVCLQENNQKYARTKQENVYSKEVYNVEDLIPFLINAIDKNMIVKGKKKDYGKGKKVVYEFKYKDNDPNVNSKETIRIIIPGRNRNTYKSYEKQLDSLVKINIRVRNLEIIKKIAIVAAGVTLMTFATIKTAKVADKEFETNSKEMSKYVSSFQQTPFTTEEELKQAQFEDLKRRAEEGDSQAKFEYDRYLANQASEDVSKVK